MGYLEGSVQVLPYPVALNDLKDSSPRGQKLGIGQIGSVYRDEDAGARYHLQLLMEGGACVELYNSHLQQLFLQGYGAWHNTWDMCWAVSAVRKDKKNTTPFGVSSMRSQVLYQAAQARTCTRILGREYGTIQGTCIGLLWQ